MSNEYIGFCDYCGQSYPEDDLAFNINGDYICMDCWSDLDDEDAVTYTEGDNAPIGRLDG